MLGEGKGRGRSEWESALVTQTPGVGLYGQGGGPVIHSRPRDGSLGRISGALGDESALPSWDGHGSGGGPFVHGEDKLHRNNFWDPSLTLESRISHLKVTPYCFSRPLALTPTNVLSQLYGLLRHWRVTQVERPTHLSAKQFCPLKVTAFSLSASRSIRPLASK